jgi:NADH-quinone oxidoreductase subunit J
LGTEGRWFNSNYSEMSYTIINILNIIEIFEGLMILAALLVISAKNPIHSVLSLILVFLNATGILILWNVEFLAMMVLIVYVGAISILFLFVVMMLNIKLVEIYENQMRFLPIGGMIAFLFLIEIYLLLEEEISTPNQLAFPRLDDYWDWQLPNHSHIKVIGDVLYTYYEMEFIIASLILLISMIGSLILTIPLDSSKIELEGPDETQWWMDIRW